jgi:hypothetical protein
MKSGAQRKLRMDGDEKYENVEGYNGCKEKQCMHV